MVAKDSRTLLKKAVAMNTSLQKSRLLTIAIITKNESEGKLLFMRALLGKVDC